MLLDVILYLYLDWAKTLVNEKGSLFILRNRKLIELVFMAPRTTGW